MSLHLGAAWQAVTGSPVFGVVLTLGAYQLARLLWQRLGQHPLANPVLGAILLIGGTLTVLDVDYDTYLRGGALVAFFLGPATVALAWPLYREAALVRRTALPVLLGVLVGAVAAIAAGYLLTTWLGGGEELARSMAPKSATTPVSIALAVDNGGLPALTAVFTILAGILGAVAGPGLLTLCRVRDRRVRGLAVGAASHGIGTARMLEESMTEGAFAGLGMGLTALVTAVALPLTLLFVG